MYKWPFNTNCIASREFPAKAKALLVTLTAHDKNSQADVQCIEPFRKYPFYHQRAGEMLRLSPIEQFKLHWKEQVVWCTFLCYLPSPQLRGPGTAQAFQGSRAGSLGIAACQHSLACRCSILQHQRPLCSPGAHSSAPHSPCLSDTEQEQQPRDHSTALVCNSNG